MNNDKTNQSIVCSVEQCQYHSDRGDYCSLDTIRVGTHEMNPMKVECTDCESFVVKK